MSASNSCTLCSNYLNIVWPTLNALAPPQTVAPARNYDSVYGVLSTIFGHRLYKSNHQQEAIHLVSGFDRDLLVSLPPNSGKSLVYQVPALLHNRGLTIVVSPHIALINNQLSHLHALGIHQSTTVNSQSIFNARVMGELEREDCQIRILYVTPETLLSDKFRPTLNIINQHNLLKLIAIDEAQCVKFNPDFRPHYRKLGQIRDIFPSVPIVALTSVGTSTLMDEIKSFLRLKSPKEIIDSDMRVYLYRQVITINTGYNSKLLDMRGHLLRFLIKPGLAIIFFRSIQSCDRVTSYLNDRAHIPAAKYHSSMDVADLAHNMRSWISGETRVMCALNSFGLGIHHPNVRLVILFSTPFSLSNYYQLCGRPGRDGRHANCILYYDPHDIGVMDTIFYNRQLDVAIHKSDSRELEVATLEADYIEFLRMIGFMEMRRECRHQVLAEEFAPNRLVASSFHNCYDQCDNCRARYTVIKWNQIYQPIRSAVPPNMLALEW